MSKPPESNAGLTCSRCGSRHAFRLGALIWCRRCSSAERNEEAVDATLQLLIDALENATPRQRDWLREALGMPVDFDE